MEGLGFCNAALEVEAVAFAPWAGHWLGVVVTPWFINLVLTQRDPAAWQPLAQGAKRRYRFPAGDYDFIGAHDALAGEYQACSLFSPVLEFDDHESARLVARLAREALFDPDNAEVPEVPPSERAFAPAATSGDEGDAARPAATVEPRLATPMSKRDFLRGRTAAPRNDDRG